MPGPFRLRPNMTKGPGDEVGLIVVKYIVAHTLAFLLCKGFLFEIGEGFKIAAKFEKCSYGPKN